MEVKQDAMAHLISSDIVREPQDLTQDNCAVNGEAYTDEGEKEIQRASGNAVEAEDKQGENYIMEIDSKASKSEGDNLDTEQSSQVTNDQGLLMKKGEEQKNVGYPYEGTNSTELPFISSENSSQNHSSSSGEPSPASSYDQDSGVTPDDVHNAYERQDLIGSANSTSFRRSNIMSMKESKSSLQAGEDSECTQKDHSIPDHGKEQCGGGAFSRGQPSPEGSGGASETLVMVSDLDSPASPSSVSQAGATADAEVATASASLATVMESVYYIKWIIFGGSNVPIITQNENGPCPLLALVNVLLLKGKMKLAPMLEMITSEQLMTYLGECILENTPKNLPETTQANYEQNMQDAIGVMHKLQTGLDVNVKFTGVKDFEYTPELIVFDLLGISLFHGWLVDPQDMHTVEAVNQCSYNQLVEKIISLKHSDKEDMVMQALTAEQFLERTASQLTYHGLAELSFVVKENELCVFFRNNHFSTLYRHNSELFLLVTDQGFLTESQVVWETLSNVEGDCHFTDATFRTYTKPATSNEPILPDPNVTVGSPEQIDHDYQVALFLQEEVTASASSKNEMWPTTGFPNEQLPSFQADHDLALRLQEEENRREVLQARLASHPTGQQYPHQQPWARNPLQQEATLETGRHRRRIVERREKEDKNCMIL